MAGISASISKAVFNLALKGIEYSGKPKTARAVGKLVVASTDANTKEILAQQSVANLHRYKRLEDLPLIGKQLPHLEAKSIGALSNAMEKALPGSDELLNAHLLPRIRQAVVQHVVEHPANIGKNGLPYTPKTLQPMQADVTPLQSVKQLGKTILAQRGKTTVHPLAKPLALTNTYFKLPTAVRQVLEGWDEGAVNAVEQKLNGLYPQLGTESFRHFYTSLKRSNIEAWKQQAP
jgi:hypothetical protein